MNEKVSSDLPDWESLPSYMELLSKTVVSVRAFSLNATNCYTIQEDLNFAKSLLMDVPRSQVILLAAITLSLTMTRAVMSAYIFEPLARWLRLTPSDSAKFPESAWKLLVYSILWAFSFEVIVISERHDYLQRPTRIWNFSDEVDHYSQPMPNDIFWMYMLQLGFYLHSIYATLYMDVWRKDSVTMLFHHGITIFLIQFSFLVKYHKIGALVLFLHDVSDVFLEFTKINVYLKHRDRRFHVINDMLSSVGFVAFAGSWAFFRLYWFPLKVLYSSTWGVYLHHKDTKGPRLFIYFNIMLWLLLGLHVYWFWFILVLMYRIATGQLKELDDTREYDSGCGSSGEESSTETHSKKNGTRNKANQKDKAMNGTVKCGSTIANGTVNHMERPMLNGAASIKITSPKMNAEPDGPVANGSLRHAEPEQEIPIVNGLHASEPETTTATAILTDGDGDRNGVVNRQVVVNGAAVGDSDEEEVTNNTSSSNLAAPDERLLNGNVEHSKE